MSLDEYFAHYLKSADMWIFLLLSTVIIFLVFGILYAYSRMTCQRLKNVSQNPLRSQLYHVTEKFSELIFSGTSILMFMTAYYLIERFVAVDSFMSVWNKYKDFLLLLFIVISCIFNTLMDHVIIRLKHLDSKDRAPIRLLGMLYMILIFCYIKFIYENNNYDFFISYFLGLMIGRFVYFDASFKGFVGTIKEAITNIPLLLFALCSTGLLSLYGFSTKYLIKHIGVLTNVFFIHLFMCVSLFILFHSHIIDFVTRPQRTAVKKADTTDEDYAYDDDYEDDDC